MQFAPLQPTSGSYVAGDLADCDHVCWSRTVLADPVLMPTGAAVHDLESLLSNRSPGTGKNILRNFRDPIGYSLVLTAPKCFSVLELVKGDSRLRELVLDAVQSCLELSEFLASVRGIQPDGKSASDLVACACFGRLNTADLPHRHVHFNIFKMVRNPQSGLYVAPNLEQLLRSDDLLQAFFQHRLSAGLVRLGYICDHASGSFRIQNVSDKLIRQFFRGGLDEDLARPQKRMRPAEYFQVLQAGWLADADKIDPQFRKQKAPARIREIYRPWRNEFFATELDLLCDEFFVPAAMIVSKTLQRCPGYDAISPSKIARQVLTVQNDGNYKSFELDHRIVHVRSDHLEEERSRFADIRHAGSAYRGWLTEDAGDDWWADRLRKNFDRVVVLRKTIRAPKKLADAELSNEDLAALQRCLRDDAKIISPEEANNFQPARGCILIVNHADTFCSRKLASIISAQLGVGGRVLLIGDRFDWRALWLNRLSEDAGVQLIYPGCHEKIIIGEAEFTVRGTKALDAFEQKARNINGALLLCETSDVENTTRELRYRWLMKNLSANGTFRLQLRPTDKPIEKGFYIQFRRRTDSLPTKWPLQVVDVEPHRIRVSLYGSLCCYVSREHLVNADIFQPVENQVRVGDRIRLERDIWLTRSVRLRAKRKLKVKSVRLDGSIVVAGSRILGPEVGHWNYDYCAPIDGPIVPAKLLVCNADDLDRILSAGWSTACRRFLVCDPNIDNALAAVHRAAEKDLAPAPKFSPGAEDIGFENDFDSAAKPEVKPPEITPPANPAPKFDPEL